MTRADLVPTPAPSLLVVSSRMEALVVIRCLLDGWLAIEAVSALPHLLLALATDRPDAILLVGSPTADDGLANVLLTLPPVCPLLVLTDAPPTQALEALPGTRVAAVFSPHRLASLLGALECLFEGRSPVISWPVARALSTVMAGWPERASVRALAAQVGVSDSHLSHRFRRELGTSVRRLLLEVRIEKAVRFLVETDDTVQRVARLSGFTDAAHLCRTLAQHRGLRPSQVRGERWRGVRMRQRGLGVLR